MTAPGAGRPIRVLVVDDSSLMRQMLTGILAAEDDLEVVGAARDPLEAREMIKQLNPDVLTLDIEMPRMDGLDFLERLMTLRPMPVVMVSTLTTAGADASVRALELGAVDVVAKPRQQLGLGMAALTEELLTKVRMAASARIRPLARSRATPRQPASGFARGERVIAIGASTGGVEALRHVIAAFPADVPPVLIVQHLPASFTASFSARLDGIAACRVTEAADGMPVRAGHVYIAPGDAHLRLVRSGDGLSCQLGQDPAISGHRPSADALFASVAAIAGASAVGAILTGMGRDGADGLKRMRDAGAMTFGQDASSCVVYGMPKAAMETGGVCRELPLEQLVPELLQHCRSSAGRRGQPIF